MKIIKGGITAPAGFSASGVAAQIKTSGKKDVALIVSGNLASAAGLFTSNIVKAAPVIVSAKHLASGVARAIIANAGNANACTGERGLRDAETMAAYTAKTLGISPSLVLVASTGAIGHKLPMDKIANGIRMAAKKLSKTGGAGAAEAILTTDLVKKEIAVQIVLQGKNVRIGGIAKGSGMIAPELVPHATMFCFIATDAKISPKFLSAALSDAVRDSFNMITVDNDRSTNDTIFVLANGASGIKDIKMASADLKKFTEALRFVCAYLAKEIARDGEGATKLVEIRVSGARSDADARIIAKTIAGSNLFKAAAYGSDPNWGRVMAALGYSGVEFDPDKVDVSIGGIKVVKSGGGIEFDRARARKYLQGKEAVYSVNLNSGKHSAAAWGCDLSYDYVKINAEYHT